MAATGWLLIVIIGAAAGGAIESVIILVLPSTTICEADGPNEIGVPAMVTAAAPGAIVWLPITNCEAALAVIGSLLKVMTAAGGGGAAAAEGKAAVVPPTTMFEADGPREI